MLSKELLLELQEYVGKHLQAANFVQTCADSILREELPCESMAQYEMEDFVRSNKKPSFSEMLFKYIDKKGTSDTDIYKKAGIDRRHFSKIRSNADYHPSKYTAIAFALALELEYKEALKLIQAAGYSLSDSDTFDLVITFCLKRKIYNILDVNHALDYFSLKPLAGVLE